MIYEYMYEINEIMCQLPSKKRKKMNISICKDESYKYMHEMKLHEMMCQLPSKEM